ncbi:FAD:protein FMN transferase [Bacteroidota bacterium]
MRQIFQKNRLYPVILIIVVFAVWKFRQGDKDAEKVSFQGMTMGTYYNIIYLDHDGVSYQEKIDSLLDIWNMALSTYIPGSEISRFNRDTVHKFKLPYFYPVLVASRNVYNVSNGAFDPTIMPLVNAWGFGPVESELPESNIIDSLMQYIGFDNIRFNETSVHKPDIGIQLDFSAIAKGYGVDVVGDFLENLEIENYLVEIGGEISCKGVNDRGVPWTTGVEDPTGEYLERKIMTVIGIDNKSIATSGNYRNFYVKDGKKYAHTISPFTGFPVQHSLLSASVITDDCMYADAYATAFMVLGLEKSKEILKAQDDLDAYLIYADENGELKTFITEGVRSTIIEQN